MTPNFPPNGALVLPSQLEGDSSVCSQGLGFTTAPEASLESSPLPGYLNPIRETLLQRDGEGWGAKSSDGRFYLQGSSWPDHFKVPAIDRD